MFRSIQRINSTIVPDKYLHTRTYPEPHHHTIDHQSCHIDQLFSRALVHRLLTTYRALERLSQSEFNLDRLEAAASAAQTGTCATLTVPGAPLPASSNTTGSTAVAVVAAALIPERKSGRDHVLTVKDVERQRGKQLTKYERNMMIFNWLHTLDDSVDETVATAQ